MDVDINTLLALLTAATSLSAVGFYRKLKVVLDLLGDLDDIFEDDRATVDELVRFYEKVRSIKWKEVPPT